MATLPGAELATRFRSPILQAWEREPLLDSQGLAAQLNATGLADEVKEALAAAPLPVCPEGVAPVEARARWREVYDMLISGPRRKQDVAAMEHERAASMEPERAQRPAASKLELIAVRLGAEGAAPK